MDYKKMRDNIYIRIDKGEDVVETILSVCEKEKLTGGHFQGIGACDFVAVSTYIAEKQEFVDHTRTGMIEMISLMGNISSDDEGKLYQHSHAVFSYLNEDGEQAMIAGHLKEARIGYTGEIILTPSEEKIGRMFDSRIGIDVWKLS